MPAKASASPTRVVQWKLEAGVATGSVAALEGRVDLAAPAAGIVVRPESRADHVLGIDLRAAPAAPTDAWVRGRDLAAVYEPDDARRLRATAMWREHPAAVAAWELVISAQTALWHADAALAVVSEIGGDDVFWTESGDRWTAPAAPGPLPPEAAAVLVRRHATAVVVAVHPQDPRRFAVTTARGRTTVECAIFPAAIEKGVLMRSRVLAAVGPAADAESWAQDVCVAFAAMPPFLDT